LPYGVDYPYYPLATDRGMSLMTAGILGGVIGATSLIGRISAGFFSDKVGEKDSNY